MLSPRAAAGRGPTALARSGEAARAAALIAGPRNGGGAGRRCCRGRSGRTGARAELDSHWRVVQIAAGGRGAARHGTRAAAPAAAALPAPERSSRARRLMRASTSRRPGAPAMGLTARGRGGASESPTAGSGSAAAAGGRRQRRAARGAGAAQVRDAAGPALRAGALGGALCVGAGAARQPDQPRGGGRRLRAGHRPLAAPPRRRRRRRRFRLETTNERYSCSS